MGVYLNPGGRLYKQAVNSEIYVDKSLLIDLLNNVIDTESKYICVSRPRRFGKTITANMISAYYDRTVDGAELFNGLSIQKTDNYETYRNKYDVIHINMLDFFKEERKYFESINKLTNRLIFELSEEFPDVSGIDNNDLSYTMSRIYDATKHVFIIVIDEWDCIFRRFPEDIKGQKAYLDFLRDWLKDKSYVALAYMTGIFPIKKYGEHSALNMFDEFSMTSAMRFAPYVGFTEDEVKKLCEERNCDFNKISDWYDGYELTAMPGESAKVDSAHESSQLYHIYSPLSVIKAIESGSIQNYWNSTETYDALKENINRNYDNLKEKVVLLMNGSSEPVSIRKYQNDMTSFKNTDDVLTMLIHLGYLAYHENDMSVYIPNKEILDEFKQSVEGQTEWTRLFEILNESQKLIEATWNEDEKLVSKLIEHAHNSMEAKDYNSESALSHTIRMAYFNAEQYYTLIPEMPAGKGYADLTYIPLPDYPDKPALLIELKMNKSAETALKQIYEKKYADTLKKYEGNILLIGINYDAKTKAHSCSIERA